MTLKSELKIVFKHLLLKMTAKQRVQHVQEMSQSIGFCSAEEIAHFKNNGRRDEDCLLHMTTIYGIKACDSMKKAFTLLDQLGVAYVFFDYKKQVVDAEKLKNWIEQLGLDVVLNKRGTTWRKLDDTQKAQADSTTGAIALMQQQPSLIKRPILVHESGILCGFDAQAYQNLTQTESAPQL